MATQIPPYPPGQGDRGQVVYPHILSPIYPVKIMPTPVVPVAEISPLRDARDQLTMILSFFSRVDAKLSTILAIDTAMLASMSAGIPPLHQLSVLLMLPFGVAAGLLVGSYYCLYRGGFPNLKGGHSSNVYFKDIAARNESRFVDDYKNQSWEALRLDLLSQIWRNSEILTEKFRYLRFAFVCMAFAAVPWVLSLALFAMERGQFAVQHP
jgi:hypothetical protein